MIMRKLSLILSLTFLVISFVIRCSRSGDDNVSFLKEAIEVSNSQCPLTLSSAGDIVGMDFDEQSKVVQIHCLANENLVDIDELKKNKSLVSKSMKLSLSKSTSQEMLNLVVNAGASLVMDLKGSESGKTVKFTFAADDLKALVNNPLPESEINKLLLENQIAIVNRDCPCPEENGVQMMQVYDEGPYVIYAYRIDEDVYDLSAFKSVPIEIKKELLEGLDDPSIKCVQLMVTLGKGLIYRVCGSISGESADIIFDVDELEALVH